MQAYVILENSLFNKVVKEQFMHIPSLIISDWSFELFTGASSFKHTKLVMLAHGGVRHSPPPAHEAESSAITVFEIQVG